MTSSHDEVQALLIHLLTEGFPATFAEVYQLLYNKPKGNGERPETRDFLVQVKAQLTLAETAKRTGYPEGVIQAYVATAGLYRTLEQTRLAVFFLDRALNLARASSSPASECVVLHALVLAQEALGHVDGAVEAAEAHRAAAHRAGSVVEEGRAAEELVRVYRLQASEAEGKSEAGGDDAVLQMRLMELGAARECGDPKAEAEATYAVGRAYMGAGTPAYGVSYFKQYLKLAKQLQAEHGDAGLVARAYAALAGAHQSQHSFDAALQCLQELLEVSASTGNDSAHAHALESLGTLYARQGKQSEAEASLTSGYKLRKALMESGAAGASRPELDKARIFLGLVKAAAAGPRSGALFDKVVANNTQALLDWKVTRVELAVPPVPTAHPSTGASGEGAGGGEASGAGV